MINGGKSWVAVGFSLLCCVTLGGCPAGKNAVETVPKNTTAQLQPEISRLFFDITRAQRIAQGAPGTGGPQAPIKYEFGTDSLHKTYIFSNLRALRLSIKHRIDSLRAAGAVVSYDTVLGSSVHGTLQEHAVNKESKNQ